MTSKSKTDYDLTGLEELSNSLDFRKTKEISVNHVNFSDKDKVSIILMGDEHFGSKYFDEDTYKEWINWIKDQKDTYVICMGDNLETATKESIGAGIFEQNKDLTQQLLEFSKLLMPIKDKILGLHRGNHEERIYKYSGLDLTRILASILGVKYFGIGVINYIQVGNQNYSIYTTHGHSNSRLPHTKIKACIDLANMVDVDIYGMGHTHQLSHHVRQFYRVDKRKKTMIEDTKNFLLTGSFLSHWGSYAQEAGYEMMRKGCPRIKLHGESKLVKISLG